MSWDVLLKSGDIALGKMEVAGVQVKGTVKTSRSGGVTVSAAVAAVLPDLPDNVIDIQGARRARCSRDVSYQEAI